MTQEGVHVTEVKPHPLFSMQFLEEQQENGGEDLDISALEDGFVS